MEDIEALQILWEQLKKAINSTNIKDIKHIHWKEEPYGNEFFIITDSSPVNK